ncbi:MAG: C69 family dipeptidase [Spirochaetales bacterium]|nr:C69 family dipeptidase [Spirochaetales bacterium]
MFKKNLFLIFAVLTLFIFRLPACTSLIVTSGASKDGSVMLSYSMDASFLYGELYFWPAADHAPGTMIELYDWWDDGKYMGEIPQVDHTFQVTGNINDHQVAIAESTFIPIDRELLSQSRAIMDVGNLMYITLQRASTAREAIAIMAELTEQYGYAGFGESFSIIDKNEAWIMEIVGKGRLELGAVWVARRIPDGYVAGHANQARITTFPLDDPENCLYAPDLISFAREKRYWTGNDKNFSFADTYSQVNGEVIRWGDRRIWNAFRRMGVDMETWAEYSLGSIEKRHPPTGAPGGIISNRMPLWVKPAKKLSPSDLMSLMRDHYENTSEDMSRGLWAGPYSLPYRTRPLKVLHSPENGFSHERPISIQQTGFSLIAQARSSFPDPIGGINWFGVDDTGHTVYVPVYCGVTDIPPCFTHREDGLINISFDSAYWLFNLVSNWSYTRYTDIFPHIKRAQRSLEEDFIRRAADTDEKAQALYISDPDTARQLLTETTLSAAADMMSRWRELWEFLVVKYLDGNIRPSVREEFLRNSHGFLQYPEAKGFPTFWIQTMLQRKYNVDLKSIYSQEEILEIYGKNNRNFILQLILLALTIGFAALSLYLFRKYRVEKNRTKRKQ